MKKNKINKIIEDSILIKRKLIKSKIIINAIIHYSDIITKSISEGGKLILCGNGGSAADAQHLAAELLIRLRPHINRSSIPALSLATDTSTITACGNDYSFNSIYSRVLESLGNQKDILICITTSGKSKNIINVLKTAKKKNIKTICFTGSNGGEAKLISDYSIVVPSNTTARIQEIHIMLGHILMELIEDNLIKSRYVKKK